MIRSPNTVLANALVRTIDVIRSPIIHRRPQRIVFVVGTQINGEPHAGTALVQTSAFALARLARRSFSLDTSVHFNALDNAPHNIVLDPETHHPYQITYHHALGEIETRRLIDGYYRGFFDSLVDATDIPYSISTYSEQQREPGFRDEFLRTLAGLDDIRWYLAPSHGVVHTRVPCPLCGWSEKRSERTRLTHISADSASFVAVCMDHGEYEITVDESSDSYLDLATLYRNVVKEAALSRDGTTLYVMIKGGDWAFGSQLVDGALSALGFSGSDLPPRIFCPQILTATGAKLSKSLLRKEPGGYPEDIRPWMTRLSAWDGSTENLADTTLWFIDQLLEDPKHFFRAYTTTELGDLMNQVPRFEEGHRARSMTIYKKYFDLIAEGEKTIEVRVAYDSMKRIKPGQYLKFVCRDESCLTVVRRVATYASFDEMFDKEDSTKINPGASVDEQLREIRRIFPAEKETLGVIAIEVERHQG